MGLCLLAQSHLPHKFWVEAFTTAAFLINWLPLHHLGNVSPYEKLFAKVPDYRFLKTFGCTCFPHLVPYNKHKLIPKSIPTTTKATVVSVLLLVRCIFLAMYNLMNSFFRITIAWQILLLLRSLLHHYFWNHYCLQSHLCLPAPFQHMQQHLCLPATFHHLHRPLLRPTLHPRLLKRPYPLHQLHIFSHLPPPLLHHRHMSLLPILLLHANLGASMLLLIPRPSIPFLTG
ncbi:hypothetical protein D8674_023225 [Pyrus ussuriensis x Pyrus communis]|uniref:Uncharacterized protein n=1 Tax=Pyrus ussuriensis x Pyrus communis TaxID=2448454 RepID=A0A5N5GNC5_9ROSA|nr:hypothetical protein D8674_023225 [Pyrus ussuriensis x Pyrus communis]